MLAGTAKLQSLHEVLDNDQVPQHALADCERILHGALSFGAVWLVRALSQLTVSMRVEPSTRIDVLGALRRCEDELAIVKRVHARALWAKVRPWTLQWIELFAQAAEERRIAMANAGVLEGDALLVPENGSRHQNE